MNVHELSLDFVVTDDYRAGPELHLRTTCDCPEECNCEEEDYYNVSFPQVEKSKIAVFEVAFYRDGTGEARLMKSFKSQKDAKRYAMIQYRLYTGENPFVADGTYNSAYHPNGQRIDLGELDTKEDGGDLEHEFKLRPAYNDSNLLWLFVMDASGEWVAYSTNPYAVW